MKKKILLSLVSCVVLANSAYSFGLNSNIINSKQVVTNNMFAQNEAIIELKSGVSQKIIIESMNKLFSGVKSHGYKLTNTIHIKVPNMGFDMIKQILENSPFKNSIKSIEKNYAQKPVSSNDSYYNKLWAIENNGQKVNGKSGTKDADMDVSEAWSIQKGSPDVVVAVLDTGVDYTHEDLADNMWRGNVHHGYDFAGDNDGNNDNDPMPDKPYDDNGHYHGTHVAGIIGAVGDNSQGVSGVAQDVQIMALKVFRPNGYGYLSDILEALDYVSDQIDKGVNIVAINASYSGGGKKGDSADKAIAKLGEKGVVFCAAAGNDSKNIDNDPVYPASYSAKNIIAIAASDQDDKLASFSNYGKKTVDVAAPGTNILSTYPDNKYAYLQGTSMATPEVTGSVALLASEDTTSSVSERIDFLKSTVDKKSSLNSKVESGGRVNINSALKKLDNSNGGDENTNNPPKANADSATTEYQTKVTIDVLKNDTDADGDNLTIKSTTNPSHGSVAIRNGKIDYTPDNGFSGNDSFKYTISDGKGGSSTAKVTVNVKEKKKSGGFFGGLFGGGNDNNGNSWFW